MENLIKSIKTRYSTRSFDPRPIEINSLSELNSFIGKNNIGITGEISSLHVVATNPGPDKKMKLDYGMIKNHHTYLMGEADNTIVSRVNYGFVMEKAILKATSLGLASCWIGYFDAAYFEGYNIGNPSNVPALAILGYPSKSPAFTSKLFRTLTKATSRKDRADLFFENDSNTPLSKNIAEEYINALEMLRWAPSAGNTQPWRVVFERGADTFHFFKQPISKRYDKDGLHDIDLGIALAHFDITLKANNVSGTWFFGSSNVVNEKWVYIMSWRKG